LDRFALRHRLPRLAGGDEASPAVTKRVHDAEGASDRERVCIVEKFLADGSP